MKLLPALSLFAPLLLASCNNADPGAGSNGENTQPVIAAVNYPLAYFAERLAGDFATILFEAPTDEDPAFWQPTDQQIENIQRADLILLNGASYAKWTATAILPFETSVDTSASFESNFIKVENAVKHVHRKDEAAHSHSGTAFTTWMDLKQAAAQAAAVANAIMEDFPDHKDPVNAKHLALQQDLLELDQKMSAATAALKGSPILASHPVYQYFARAYDLDIHSLLWEPEMNLDDSAISDLQKLMQAHPGASLFLWEGDPLPENIEKLQALGLTSIVVSPAGNRPEIGDFLAAMQSNLAALKAAAPSTPPGR